MVSYEMERESWRNGRRLLGCDEAGYGSACGSLFCAAVAFPPDFDYAPLADVRDSKKLSERKRFELETLILGSASTVLSATINPQEIDDGNPYWLRFEALADIIKNRFADLSQYDIVMDGDVPLKLPQAASSTCLVKGDDKCITIAAASIIAKCAKDREMLALDLEFPGYGLASNKGYLSKEHCIAIQKLGMTREHRRKYCKKILGE